MADRTMKQLKAQINRARKRRKVVAASIHLDAQCIACGTWYKLSGVGQASGRRTCSRSCRRKLNPEPPESRRERDRRRYATQEYREQERERRMRRAEYTAAYNAARKDVQAEYDKARRKRLRAAEIEAYRSSPAQCIDCSKPQPWRRRNCARCEQCELVYGRARSNEYTKAAYHSDPAVKARMIGHAHTRRARQLNTQTEPINPLIVFNRDAWKCQRLGCGKTTRIDVKRNASNRAVLGHINALAAGGTHTYDNVCCLCHPCNVEDGVNKATIQRSLIA